MLSLLFQLGDDRYALPASLIREVLPFVQAEALPGTPPWLCGLLNCRGEQVPALDLARLLYGRPALEAITTRMILVDYPLPDGDSRPLALVAEHVTETRRLEPEGFADAGLNRSDSPHVCRTTRHEGRLVRLLSLDQLLPQEVRDLLYYPETA
ncbi:MAG TPA: purine-binding chemotaxis protein CheW [Gammaproteobacteria bacterium]|nr:purine-binding chemotaxis protein CheW [Gammaproteobacteria bacterium]